MNYYIVLGIMPGATADEVRQAYVRLAKMYHPDKNKSPDATVKMAEINVAYETLCDIERRREYDLENDIAEIDADDFEEDEIGQEEEASTGWSPGKCVKCNFVNNSGVFVCSTCGHVFDPHAKARKEEDFDELGEQASEETLSEIIRCPRCNEINKYSGGSSCWQCGLLFEIDELA